MIIVDNIAENFQLQPKNGILIKSWLGDPQDTALYELAPVLIGKRDVIKVEIVKKGIDDVRDALKIYSIQMARQNEEGVEKFHLTLDNE